MITIMTFIISLVLQAGLDKNTQDDIVMFCLDIQGVNSYYLTEDGKVYENAE